MFSFQHPGFLWLILLIIPVTALYYYALYRKRKTAALIGEPALVKELTQSYLPKRYFLKFLLITLSIICLVIATANPRSAGGKRWVEKNGIDVMIALDVSNSMLADDIPPSRLLRAKQLLNRLLSKLDNNRVGMVLFAGNAYLQMPLTGDLSAASMYINVAAPDLVPTQGTNIAEALQRSNGAFNSEEERFKSIVLITDGEEHDDNAISVAEDMAKQGVVINCIGMGNPDGTVLVFKNTGEIKKDAEGNPVITKLNEKLLMSIASKTNGTYYRYENSTDAVDAVTDVIGSMEKRITKDETGMEYNSYFIYFLLLAFTFLIIEMMVSDKRHIRNVKLKPVLIFFVCFPLWSTAQMREANKLYNDEKFEEAARLYENIIEQSPSFTAYYNYANALYKSKKPEEAVKAYDQALTFQAGNLDRATAYFNKGVVLQNSGNTAACIAAYKACLRLDPDDQQARHNLQKALREMNEKQKQQQPEPQPNEQQQPEQQPSRLNRKEAEEKLNALRQQEQNLQEKVKTQEQFQVLKPVKDW